MIAPRLVRFGLVVIAIGQAVGGSWQLFAPRSFYDDFPLSSHPWVSLLPSYNEHLMVDAGAQNLAMGMMVCVAAVLMQPNVVRTVLAGSLVFNALHFGFHATHLAHYPTVDAASQTVALTVWLVIVAGLLALTFIPRAAGRDTRNRRRWPEGPRG